ncbi:unnamed protein product [Darwinula stevensoni]|uniref:Trafficking protein particle complex subunit 6B n=1 Tax=Darwinula stevensoni TaxID=69355 RepID=A0A7R9AC55_9CRUS|nr:unnamed protein product [Darwinula stevensoni]CAG0899527.1 unnamed protein product [Darwinula stevensoni]
MFQAGGNSDEGLFDYLHMELVSTLLQPERNPGIHLSISTMEHLGFSSGYRLVERLTREWPRFKDELDSMKFICKEFWTAVFRKQVDNLRTNRQGVYVLQDNRFRHLAKVSTSGQYMEAAPKLVVFTCGLVRGALANLGIVSVVTAEVSAMPICKFQVQIQRASA